MRRIYVPTKGPECWQALLADPALHWRPGFSARTLAQAWEAAVGLPPEIGRLIAAHEDFAGGEPELLLAIPEHKVALPGGGRASQTDLFALVREGSRTVAVAVEGKVDEPFGPTLADWSADASAGKRERLDFIRATLGLAAAPDPSTAYQLLHRTASAAIEARRFKTDAAAMIVHSFSPQRSWFDAFAQFVRLFSADADPEALTKIALPSGQPLYLGWAAGDQRFRCC